MKEEDIEGLTPAQIKDKFALPAEPKYIVDVTLDATTKLRVGEFNSPRLLPYFKPTGVF